MSDLLGIVQNEHFRSIAAILHIPLSSQRWRSEHPQVPFLTLWDALADTVALERPYQAQDTLTALVALQVAVAEADPHLALPEAAMVWLIERLEGSDGKLIVALLTAYASATWEYATPAEVAAATGTDDSWWRQQAIAGTIPGAFKKGKQWLLPTSVLRLRGIAVGEAGSPVEDDDDSR